MRFYFAAAEQEQHRRNLVNNRVENILCTYLTFMENHRKAKLFADDMRKPSVIQRVFLDSGAFGAMTRGVNIDLSKYMDFIYSNENILDSYAGLDVIGDPESTLDNVMTMEKNGLSPLWTFHYSKDQGVRYDLLDEQLKNRKHIALGGMVGASRPSLVYHLDKCFGIIRRHWPVRLHAYGLTAGWALQKYPFYSADSSNVIVHAARGSITDFENGRIITKHSKDCGSANLLRSGTKDDYIHRTKRNAISFQKYQDFLSDLWAKRGIIWKD